MIQNNFFADCRIAAYCICCTLSAENQCDKAGNGLFLPILPNDQDCHIVVILQALEYMLFSRKLKDLTMKALMVKMATMKLSPWLQEVMMGDLFFLIKRFEVRLKAR